MPACPPGSRPLSSRPARGPRPALGPRLHSLNPNAIPRTIKWPADELRKGGLPAHESHNMIASSRTRFVKAISNAMAAVEFAPCGTGSARSRPKGRSTTTTPRQAASLRRARVGVVGHQGGDPLPADEAGSPRTARPKISGRRICHAIEPAMAKASSGSLTMIIWSFSSRFGVAVGGRARSSLVWCRDPHRHEQQHAEE